jgi:magnesium-transporting ATPase (P-type)
MTGDHVDTAFVVASSCMGIDLESADANVPF